ncbi:hypothetical protein ACFZ8E_25145 [Methylobacterium sp. HMF5984]|uniref:hypothetical protein n=1 Tax=Methylobacterium sp. HMF5984 TaxID=3367370 RepID=UPI0038538485
MSGGTKTQTTTQNTQSDPWAPAQPALQQILSGATTALNSGVGSQVYTGQRVAGLGSDTVDGLDAMKTGAAAGTSTAAAGNSYLGSLLGSGGSTAATQAATAGIAGVNTNVDTSGVSSAAARLADPNSIARTTGAALAGGNYATDASPLSGLASNLATGGTQTERSLQDVADGKYLSGGNPYLQAMIDKATTSAASTVGQKFAASGRYGSGRFAGATAEAAQNADLGLRYQDYSTERDRQAAAAGAIDSAENARASTATGVYQGLAGINQGNAGLAATGAGLSLSADQAGLTGASTLASLQGSNADRTLGQQGALLSAAQGDRAAGLAAIGAEGANQAALTAPGQTMAQVGAIQDAARQDQLTSDQTVFDEQQAAPWKQLGLASSVVDPIAGMGGTTSGTTVQKIPQASFFQQLMGGLIGAGGAAANSASALGKAGLI